MGMEMTQKLTKYLLDFQPALEYIQDDFENTNALSSELLNSIDFKQGTFFTLLPSDANLKGLYDFKSGGILPQFPEETQFINGHISTFSWIPNINDEISEWIINQLRSQKNLSCVIDKVTGAPSGALYQYYSEVNPLCYNQEVYFHLSNDTLTKEALLKCMKASTSFWHSLCLLTTANLHNVTKTLTIDKIKEICSGTTLIMVGAYDGEGYIFWEKTE